MIFLNDDYSAAKITKMSKVKWYPITSNKRAEFVNLIQMTSLELYDSRALGELYDEAETIFRIDAVNERPWEFYDAVHV